MIRPTIAIAIAQQKEIEKEGRIAFCEGEFVTAIRQATIANRQLCKWPNEIDFFISFLDSLPFDVFVEYCDAYDDAWQNNSHNI